MEKKSESNIFKKYFRLINIIGLVIGIILGYIYYIKVGCNSGSCPITSNPWMSMIWGGILGYLVSDLFKKTKEN
jgi:small basic protein